MVLPEPKPPDPPLHRFFQARPHCLTGIVPAGDPLPGSTAHPLQPCRVPLSRRRFQGFFPLWPWHCCGCCRCPPFRNLVNYCSHPLCRYLAKPRLTGPPLPSFFGFQVSIPLLLAFCFFLLLPSTYGELRFDLAGLDIALGYLIDLVETAFSRPPCPGQVLIIRLLNCSFGVFSIVWLSSIFPIANSLVGIHWKAVHVPIVIDLPHMPCNLFLPSLCVFVVYCIALRIAHWFGLCFALPNWLLLGCPSPGCYHSLGLTPVWFNVLLYVVVCFNESMVRGPKGIPLRPVASPVYLFFLVLGWDCLYVGISTSWHMLSSLLELHLYLSLTHSSPLIMQLECSLFMVYAVAAVFWIVYCVSTSFAFGRCTLCLLVLLLGVDCLVWRLVAPLVCGLCSSPDSGYGFLGPLVCCWMAVCSFGLWNLLWVCATSSIKLRQPISKAFLLLPCVTMGCVVCCSETPALIRWWYPGVCIPFLWPIVTNTQCLAVCWQLLLGSRVWQHLSLLFPALASVDGSRVWKIVSTIFETALVPGYCNGMVCFVLWLRLGLCVTGLLIFRQPQRPMVVPLVYDADCLRWELYETYCCILLLSVLQCCFRWYSEVFWVHDPLFALPWICLQLGVYGSWFWSPLQLWLLLLGGFIYLRFCHVLWVSQLYIFFVHLLFGLMYRLTPCYTMYIFYVFEILLSRVMARGGKLRILPSKASPLPNSRSLLCSRETFFWPFLPTEPRGSLDTCMEMYHHLLIL